MTRLLLINPNISDNVTELIRAEALRSASPGTTIEVVTAPFGVAYIETRFEALIGALALDAIGEAVGRCDAARPPPLQATLQRLGLSSTLEGVSSALLNECIQSRQSVAVIAYPVLVVSPRIV